MQAEARFCRKSLKLSAASEERGKEEKRLDCTKGRILSREILDPLSVVRKQF